MNAMYLKVTAITPQNTGGHSPSPNIAGTDVSVSTQMFAWSAYANMHHVARRFPISHYVCQSRSKGSKVGRPRHSGSRHPGLVISVLDQRP